MTERSEMEAAIEAVLFVSSEPVPRERLAEIFDEGDREAAREAIEAVIARYGGGRAGDGAVGGEGGEGFEGGAGGERGAAADDGGIGGGRGVFIEEVAGGVRLVTRPEMNPWLRRFFEVTGASKLSMAAIETLAIIAYRQPVTAPEVQELRSVSPAGVIKTLLERRMVRIAGRKEVVGRPFLYTTTREFLVHFGLKSLKDLPPLEELDDALDEAGDGLGEPPPPEAGLEAGPGVDREERILRNVAAIEEADEAREDGEAGEGEAAPEGRRAGGAPAAEAARALGRPVPVGSADALQEADSLQEADPRQKAARGAGVEPPPAASAADDRASDEEIQEDRESEEP
jgi:segregation and condensation protein B